MNIGVNNNYVHCTSIKDKPSVLSRDFTIKPLLLAYLFMLHCPHQTIMERSNIITSSVDVHMLNVFSEDKLLFSMVNLLSLQSEDA